MPSNASMADLRVADNTVSLQQRGRPFRRGTSGNPAGRPVGSRNRVTLAAEALLEGQGEALARKAIELALGGDPTALRLCIERIVPRRYDRPLQFKLPNLRTAADAVAAVSAIAAGVANGELSGTEAGVLVGLVGCFRETLAIVDQEARLTALERRFME